MRTSLACLLLASTSVLAAPASEPFDPVKFEQRFHKADTNKDSQLSRKEAYAEFPRMPEFFDEIDSNRDNAITLPEVKDALQRRVDAAFKATRGTGNTAAGNGGLATAPATVHLDDLETDRAIRKQYYESLADDMARAREAGEVAPRAPSTPLFEKRY